MQKFGKEMKILALQQYQEIIWGMVQGLSDFA